MVIAYACTHNGGDVGVATAGFTSAAPTAAWACAVNGCWDV